MNDKRKALGRGLEQLFNDEGLNFDTIENSIIDLYAFASSIEVKFSLCKFSSNAICIISSSEKSFTIAGIVCIPANLDALNLLSPAIIS